MPSWIPLNYGYGHFVCFGFLKSMTNVEVVVKVTNLLQLGKAH